MMIGFIQMIINIQHKMAALVNRKRLHLGTYISMDNYIIFLKYCTCKSV